MISGTIIADRYYLVAVSVAVVRCHRIQVISALFLGKFFLLESNNVFDTKLLIHVHYLLEISVLVKMKTRWGMEFHRYIHA